LFTQCSKCETIFRLSPEVLRAAGGQVRCGRCGEVFNAVARLAEEPTGFVSGESSLDLETRADNILQAPAEAPPDESPSEQPASDESAEPKEFDGSLAPGVEVAHLEVLPPDEPAAAMDPAPAAPAREISSDETSLDDTSLEYTLPPGELDRIFIESTPRDLPSVLSEPMAEPSTEITGSTDSAELRRRLTGIEVSEDVRRDMMAAYEKALPENRAQHPGRGALLMWLSAGIVLLVLLAAQMLHQNRERLMSHQPQSAALRTLYSMLGVAMPAAANLSAYQLRQWGVTGDPSANGTLRVRASILNTAAQPQPSPLLRVTLANRFGTSIGARDFAPAEYLGNPAARTLSPGERVDATLDILDPGKNAEGFEIDVCLRGANGRVACANDAAAQPKQ
jgi:predicted Zn finger-like uncharacterized protein